MEPIERTVYCEACVTFFVKLELPERFRITACEYDACEYHNVFPCVNCYIWKPSSSHYYGVCGRCNTEEYICKYCNTSSHGQNIYMLIPRFEKADDGSITFFQ